MMTWPPNAGRNSSANSGESLAWKYGRKPSRRPAPRLYSHPLPSRPAPSTHRNCYLHYTGRHASTLTLPVALRLFRGASIGPPSLDTNGKVRRLSTKQRESTIGFLLNSAFSIGSRRIQSCRLTEPEFHLDIRPTRTGSAFAMPRTVSSRPATVPDEASSQFEVVPAGSYPVPPTKMVPRGLRPVLLLAAFCRAALHIFR